MKEFLNFRTFKNFQDIIGEKNVIKSHESYF